MMIFKPKSAPKNNYRNLNPDKVYGMLVDKQSNKLSKQGMSLL